MIILVLLSIMGDVSKHPDFWNIAGVALTAIVAFTTGVWAVQSYISNRQRTAEKEKNKVFREKITSEIEAIKCFNDQHKKMYEERLSKSLDIVSSEMRMVVDSVKEMREDIKESLTLHEENRAVDERQEEAIKTLKTNYQDHARRISELEKKVG